MTNPLLLLATRVGLDDLTYIVEGRWSIVEGRVEPIEVSVSALQREPGTDPPVHPVTANAMRRLPLETILADQRAELAQKGLDPGTEGDRQVAAIYRSAWGDGRPVTKAVADHFKVSTSTAAKRIMAARRAGLLEGVGPKP
jgi:hypothetical protein